MGAAEDMDIAAGMGAAEDMDIAAETAATEDSAVTAIPAAGVRVVHRSEPRIAVDLRIGFDRQMREPTVRSRAVPVHRVGSDLDHVARQQLAGRLALGLIISPAAHGDEKLLRHPGSNVTFEIGQLSAPFRVSRAR